MELKDTSTDNLIFENPPLEGYYKFTMLTSSRQAIDEWIDHIDKIWAHHTATGTHMGILIDSSQIPEQPLRYAFRRGIELSRKHPNIPRGRTAFIMNKSALITLLDSFLRILRLNWEYRYFDKDEQEEAIAWAQGLLDTTEETVS